MPVELVDVVADIIVVVEVKEPVAATFVVVIPTTCGHDLCVTIMTRKATSLITVRQKVVAPMVMVVTNRNKVMKYPKLKVMRQYLGISCLIGLKSLLEGG